MLNSEWLCLCQVCNSLRERERVSSAVRFDMLFFCRTRLQIICWNWANNCCAVDVRIDSHVLGERVGMWHSKCCVRNVMLDLFPHARGLGGWGCFWIWTLGIPFNCTYIHRPFGSSIWQTVILIVSSLVKRQGNSQYNYPILRERLVFVSYIVSGLEIGYIL